MGFLKSVGSSFIYITLVLAVITFIPGLPPQAEFSEYDIVPPRELSEKLRPNDRLNESIVLHEGQLKGPESFDSFDGELYTGLHRGYVVKIDDQRIVPVVKFGQECDEIWQEHKCGRPLGLKFNKKGELFVIDAYYGIFKVDIKTKKYQKIIDVTKPINGRVPKVPNSLDVGENGDIYWTDSSTEFPLHDGVYAFLANPSGRLIRYNAATKTNQVLLENLAFANGIKLSDDESFVIVLETLASRIIKYNLKGPKAGTKEVFAQGLPGLPDNVHSDNDGGFLVSFIVYADSENPQLPQSLTPHPNLRKMLARFLALLEAPLKILQTYYPNPYAERFIHSIGSFEGMSGIFHKKSVVLRMDKTGKIVDAAYSSDRGVSQFSSAFIHKDHLWLGSPFNEYIAKIPLKKAFPTMNLNKKQSTSEKIQVKENKKTEEKIKMKPTTTTTTTTPPPTTTTTTQRPTTTTPKPPPTTTTTTPKPTVSKVKESTPPPKPITENKDKSKPPQPTKTHTKEQTITKRN